MQYSNATSPTTPNGGTASQDLTLVGASAGAVTLHNVAAGVAPTDAADVGQLNTAVGTLGNAINKLGSSTASDLGGGATYDATTGAVSAPSYVVGNSTYQNTGAAIAAINATLSQLAGNGLVQQTNGPHGQITIGAGTGGTVVSVAGADGNRRITGVAPGAVTANSTQAVNGAQLYQVENELNQSLGVDVVRNAYGAAASAMSQSGMPQSYEAGRSMVAMGAGSTGGQSALAFGVSRITDNGRWVMKLNGSMSTTSKGGVGGGIGLSVVRSATVGHPINPLCSRIAVCLRRRLGGPGVHDERSKLPGSKRSSSAACLAGQLAMPIVQTVHSLIPSWSEPSRAA